MARITIAHNQIAVLNFLEGAVDIITLPEPYDWNKYDTIEDWLFAEEGGNYSPDHINWMMLPQ